MPLSLLRKNHGYGAEKKNEFAVDRNTLLEISNQLLLLNFESERNVRTRLSNVMTAV
jgi:hypothetical protein